MRACFVETNTPHDRNIKMNVLNQVGRFAAAGAQGGTVFADPTFAKGMSNGKLTRSAIDRFTIVLMGGIAAESIQYGNSEVGFTEEGGEAFVGRGVIVIWWMVWIVVSLVAVIGGLIDRCWCFRFFHHRIHGGCARGAYPARPLGGGCV